MHRGGGLAVIALLVSQAAMGGDAGALADPNAPGEFGTPPLHWRVRVDDLAGAKLLLDAGADPDGRTERGVTPLVLAIDNGSPAMVALLLKAGADANQVDTAANTPLMRAAEVGVLPVVQARP